MGSRHPAADDASYQHPKGSLNRFPHHHSFFLLGSREFANAGLAPRPKRLVVGITAIPVMVGAIMPVMMTSRVGTVVLAIVPAIIGIPVQSAVPADMRA